MTPKEKAELLVDRFMPFASGDTSSRTEFVNAKHCALIAVDEIINAHKDCLVSRDIQIIYDDFFEYWQEVKTEIEKL